MDTVEFSKLKEVFANASLEEKIELYITTQGLSVDQYKELLHMYPISELKRLEDAMA